MKDNVLIITNKEDITADFVVLELERRGWSFCRFNTEDFPSRTVATIEFVPTVMGKIHAEAQAPLDLAAVRSVWYRRPRPPFIAPSLEGGLREFCYNESERFLAGLYACLDAFWVSDPVRLYAAENKPYQLKIAERLGFKIPRTLVTNDPGTAREFFGACHGRMVAKPVRNGHIPSDPPRAVYTTRLCTEDLADLSGLSLAPVIFQEWLPKRFDIRVTVIGSQVFSVSIDSQASEESQVDWRRLQSPLPQHKLHRLPSNLERLCSSLVRTLGLEFGAIDLVLTPDEEYYFLEINPNGQWAWIEQEVGLPLAAALTDLLVKGEGARGGL